MTVMEQAKTIRSAMDAAGAVLTDAEALACKAIYYQWKDLVEAEFVAEKGYRFLHGEALYRVEQPTYTFVAHYVPGAAGTESLFSRIDETHSGTADDPIPYEGNMEIFKDLYYMQHGVLYMCIRSSGQPLYHDLANLVGNYVEVVK